MSKLKTKDLVAILALVFIFAFKYLGFDGALDGMIALILGYYFARRNEPDHVERRNEERTK